MATNNWDRVHRVHREDRVYRRKGEDTMLTVALRKVRFDEHEDERVQAILARKALRSRRFEMAKGGV
jgi:hypothetical protein